MVRTPKEIFNGACFLGVFESSAMIELRQAIEPNIKHLKADHRMDCCHLKGSEAEVLHRI